ncbi:reverse transcriptase domain-containing protein [Methylotenera mobilis]|uniref:RNA-directed DNA polymerase (Reverse transcriptase) n=1 Tax=Methylotenera mobilis (strain JLW8 / ATCC BAA-1282 / DSM 17540) TaxID=583345 RepID=C6WXU2_METML|nr:reverse transcriptase domain-containing protein [Methylotenera mobilis]ACT48741.1 RNA-directed DNA polymerase (Reverse transcriptase) [Methylotenera mobilis JLW8]
MQILEIDNKKYFFNGSQLHETLPPSKLLEVYFSQIELKKIFDNKFKDSKAKGIDRLNGSQFEKQSVNHLKTINKKCLSGTYKFSPYAEVLQLKGRGKSPRLIGIPTLRDRLVLNQLKDVLAHIFPDCVPKTRANTLIHKISREIKQLNYQANDEEVMVFGCDIKGFYDEIDRNILLEILKKRIKSVKVIKLILSAISNPIVPRNYRNKNLDDFTTEKGVPQGLAISNILAAIYLSEFDTEIRKVSNHYFRYVDDILVIHKSNDAENVKSIIESKLNLLGLQIHPLGSGKTHFSKLSEEFGYLGYLFKIPKISVRQSTVERFLQSIVGKFSDYLHNKSYRLNKFKYLTEDLLKGIFLLELNERITGAISEQKKYGWVAYFSEITDLELLTKLDNAISGFFSRLDDFNNKPPKSLKRLVRTYYEMSYSPQRGYINNYDILDTNEKKIAFLSERGRLNPDRSYDESEISELFIYYKNKNLSDLEPDDATLY